MHCHLQLIELLSANQNVERLVNVCFRLPAENHTAFEGMDKPGVFLFVKSVFTKCSAIICFIANLG